MFAGTVGAGRQGQEAKCAIRILENEVIEEMRVEVINLSQDLDIALQPMIYLIATVCSGPEELDQSSTYKIHIQGASSYLSGIYSSPKHIRITSQVFPIH